MRLVCLENAVSVDGKGFTARHKLDNTRHNIVNVTSEREWMAWIT